MSDTFHIQWHITNHCNLKCRHCYQEDFSPRQNLTFDELKKIAENVFRFLKIERKKLTVNLTGGEPFLHPDWPKLTGYLSESPYVEELGIITNGFFLNKKTMQALERFPRLKLKISAEGLDRVSYEFFRGPGTFPRFQQMLSGLAGMFFEKTLMFTLLENNASQIEKILEFADAYEFKEVIVERFIPWGKGKEISQLVVSSEAWWHAVQTLMQECGLAEDTSLLLPYRAFLLKRHPTGYELYGAACVVGKDGCAIMPDATVFPCRRFPISIGNLLREPFEKIWHESTLLNKVRNRQFLKGRCRTCEIEDCLGCRALAFALTGDFLAEDPLCFLPACLQ